MKIKNIFGVNILLILVFFTYEIFFLKIDKKENQTGFFERYFEYYPVIKDGVALYTQERIDGFRPDEYMFANEIANRKKLANMNFYKLKERYFKNVFKRILNKNDYVSDIKIENKINLLNAIGNPFEGNFYDIKNVDEKSNAETFGVWNDIILKAVYCDKTGFDNGDFYILKLLKNKDGGYLDTHFLFGLLFLKKNKCYAEEIIDKEVFEVALDIAKGADEDKIFSDLYAERIVFLYWAGYGNLVKKEWIDLIRDNFNKEYGWMEREKKSFNGHASGLSLLSLIYFVEGDKEQAFYDE